MEFLRFEGARYGQAVLRRLAADRADPARAALAERAQAALDQETRYAAVQRGEQLPEPQRPLVITMHPAGTALPDGVATGDARSAVENMCSDQMDPGDGYLVDLN